MLLSLRPSSLDELHRLVERRLKGESIFLRSNETFRPNQTVDLAVVHPHTDKEWIMSGSVVEAVPASATSEAGVRVSFTPIKDGDRVSLMHFADTQGSKKTLARAAGSNEFDAAWASLVSPGHTRKGLSQLHDVLDRTPDDPRVHVGLAVGYALLGQNATALAFGRSAIQLLSENQNP